MASETTRVVVLGTGQMGSGVMRMVLAKRDLELVGAFGRRADRAGLDIADAIGLSSPLGLLLDGDLATLLERTRPHVAVQATCSTLVDAEGEIATCVEHEVPVVSIAEELAWPWAASESWAARIDALAAAHGVGIIGTGVNPGFVLDLLVVALTAVCEDVEAITATRVNDLAPYGPTVVRSQGVGLSPEAFQAGLADGSVVGHIGFPQSIAMLAHALDWPIERVEETREPIISAVERSTPFVTVHPGQVAGCLHTATGYCNGAPVITLRHPQQIHPESEGIATGDSIELAGTPPVRVTTSPEIPGGIATVALAVNVIPRLLTARPGLRTMLDLPPAAALPREGIFRG